MKRLVFAIAMILSGAAQAGEPPPALKPGEVLRGRFVQERFLKGFDKPVRSEGSFLLAPGKGLIWRGETPFPVVSAITPAGIVQSVGGRETMRLSSAKIPFLARLYDMMGGAMAGDWRALEREYAVTKSDPVVTLVPRREDGQPIKAITAQVGRFVEEVDIAKPDGDHDHLVFRDQAVSTAPLTADEVAIFEAAGFEAAGR